MRQLGLLLFFVLLASPVWCQRALVWPPFEPVDERAVGRSGLRVLASRHAELITDLPSSEAIDSLPIVIDRAVPQWEARFGSARQDQENPWRVRLCLIAEEARFESAGLMPDGRRDFANGLALGSRTWVREQPTDYYRRHLVLHEATHAYMLTELGGCGPGWYMEGIAELLGTHAWDPQLKRLSLAVFPASRAAAPDWGRVGLLNDAVADAVADRRSLRPLDAVRKLDNRTPMSPTEYAWVWALAKLLDTHPRYQERFRALANEVRADDFAARFDRAFAEDRRLLEQEWRLFVGTLCYGHDIEREAIDLVESTPLAAEQSRQVVVRADRGWQPTGVLAVPGTTYRFEASGRCVIGREPTGEPWPCEPQGVTLAYHAGRPIGELAAAVGGGPNGLLRAIPLGVSGSFVAERGGPLYLRANDTPNQLAENEGQYRVQIHAQGARQPARYRRD
ncbi:hypothetical protein [Botrimarina hoheduenensis]|uniref:DUF1570 domain-containing protein n=1 Tax=Botrimarina hoheduenensis TaxID=2528000 RepID=A0A5C5W9V9_9BACT|nr:hypothetical protein [Botrimarina hoheduenensis]TWT46412.1 hypothetical protein Pla111_15080 [Botrimarina hoheduenensis]